VKVTTAAECATCEGCGEPYCVDCDRHYADCRCPGPHQEDEYEYMEVGGVRYARRREPWPKQTTG
jgi:hypothetical protein